MQAIRFLALAGILKKYPITTHRDERLREKSEVAILVVLADAGKECSQFHQRTEGVFLCFLYYRIARD
jgi:hypothetical protein